jgi:tellurite resistance protein TehA-like permease
LHSLMRNLRVWSDGQIATLYPGCFALVMATGIISNALFFEGHREWSDVLFAVNLIAYPWLALITILRFFRFRQAMRSDLFDPRLVFSFFTIVAAPTFSVSASICAGSRRSHCCYGYSRFSSGSF